MVIRRNSVTYLDIVDGHLGCTKHLEVSVVGPKITFVGHIVLEPRYLVQDCEVLQVLLRVEPFIDLIDEGELLTCHYLGFILIFEEGLGQRAEAFRVEDSLILVSL